MRGKGCLCRCDQIKGFKIGTLFWVMGIGAKCNPMYLYKREAGRGLTHRRESHMKVSRQGSEGADLEGWSDATRA